MGTSRTGTARWKKARAKAIHAAKRNGITHCPRCHTWLNYTVGARSANAVEVDHVLAHTRGGTDDQDNLRVLCRTCNRQLGGLLRAQKKQRRTKRTRKRAVVSTVRFDHADIW